MSRARSLAVVVATVLAACSGGDDAAPPTTDDLFSPDVSIDLGGDEVSESTTTTAPELARPDVDPLSCDGFLDLDDTDVALGLLDLPMSERGVFTFSGGETCRWEWAEDDTRAVTVEPGLPSDTEPGATLLDVAGEPVGDVGDAAAWFVSGSEGVLAVRAATELGQLNFRLRLERPDIDPDVRRDVAIELARLVLPRFPGVEPPPPPEVDLAATRPPLDRSGDGLVAVLRRGVEDGSWDEGTGLVTLLGAVTGAETAPEGVADLDGFVRSGTGVVALAREYVATGDDAAAVDALERLLRQRFPSRDRLARAELTPPATTDPSTPPSTSAPSALRRATPSSEPCTDPLVGGTCIVTINLPALDEEYGDRKYLLFVGAENGRPGFLGWSEDQVGLMVEAITTSAQQFEALGEMPTVSVLLTDGDGGPTTADVGPELCTIVVTPEVRSYPEPQQRQFVAGQMAHCFLAASFTEQYTGRYDPDAWWSSGAAIWLSNEVFPDANLEWIQLPDLLRKYELQTSIVDRDQTNAMWFQHLRWQYQLQGVLDVIAGSPADPGVDALASWPDIAQVFHDFVRDLSDLGVPDSGSDQLAGSYEVPADLLEVAEPISAFANLDAFRMDRLELTVLNGRTACIDAAPSGGARMSWRSGARRETGNWSEELPTSVEGTVLFVGSSLVDGATMRVTVTDVVDDPSDCEPDEGDDAGSESPGCDLDCGPSQYYTDPKG